MEKTSYLAGTASWTDLMTPDLEGAKKFYGSLFDWTYDDGGPAMGHYNRIMIRGKQVAGMMAQSTEEMKQMPSVWNTYFDTKDLDATLAKVNEAGGKTMMGPQDVMDLGRMAFCLDPAGGAFGFWQAGKHTGAQLFGEPGAMVWNEYRSRDLKPALAFYEKALGNKIERLDGPMEYYTQKAANLMHAGFMPMPEKVPAEVPPHWTVYFAVKSADDTAAKIKSLGGTVLMEPFDTEHGRMGSARDKWGATFAFIQPVAT